MSRTTPPPISPTSDVFEELLGLVTEQVNPRTRRIDSASIRTILTRINDEDQAVAPAVRKEIPRIARAVALVVEAFEGGGRLFYIGAGTSGRLGILDASECPPTYGVDPSMVQGIIAGGYGTLVCSTEGVEDRAEAGSRDLQKRGFHRKDVLCGIAASGRTPYVHGALAWAREQNARTIFIHCNAGRRYADCADVVIQPVVGPEVIMGSTRMKAGTAQKLVLNMITTAAMIRRGTVYGNLMVDLQMNSRKLEERSRRVIMLVTGRDYAAAGELLTAAKGHVKTALVMHLGDVTHRRAKAVLRQAAGHVRPALRLCRAQGSNQKGK